jgi:hypothetical protein
MKHLSLKSNDRDANKNGKQKSQSNEKMTCHREAKWHHTLPCRLQNNEEVKATEMRRKKTSF